MKPRLFIGSSAENLEVAYAVQESLERDVESTVWTQDVFKPSRSTMEDLNDQLDETDFAVFIFAPDDITAIRGKEVPTVRDNVIFELGLFIGRIGRERTFMIAPRDVADLHFPTDLLGIMPLTYDPNRQDQNIIAALGPATSKIRKAIHRAGAKPTDTTARQSEDQIGKLVSDPDDCKILIESWMGRRSSSENRAAIKFKDVDANLGLEPGSAEKFIEEAASRWGYSVIRRGAETILFSDF